MTTDRQLVHEKTFAIAWGDMDALGHVNNARYFDYFQEARIEWLRQVDVTMTGTLGPVVVHVECTFFKPVVYPAILTLKSFIHTPGRSSFVVDHEIYQDGVLMSKGSSKVVWVDYILNQSVAIPQAILEQIKPQ